MKKTRYTDEMSRSPSRRAGRTLFGVNLGSDAASRNGMSANQLKNRWVGGRIRPQPTLESSLPFVAKPPAPQLPGRAAKQQITTPS